MHPTHLSSRQGTPLPSVQFSPSIRQGSTPGPHFRRHPSLFNKRIQTVADRAAGGPVGEDVDPKHTTDVAEAKLTPEGKFIWEKNWYPILPVKLADPSKPYGFTLIGKDLVLWRDAEENWRALDDRCSHRQARLSRGRLSERDGSLMCSFHGWCFDGEGQCTRIPQAPEDEHEKYRASRRSGVAAYPVQVKDGLIWVWGESSAAAWVESSMTEIESREEFPDADDYNWPISEMPLGYHMMTEMFFDQSHVPFVHEGTLVGAGEDAAVPMGMKLLKFGEDGFSLTSTGYIKRLANCPATIEFKPPGSCTAVFDNPSGSKTVMRGFYTPTTIGKCRIIMGFKQLPSSKDAKPKGGIVERVQRMKTFLDVRFLLRVLENGIMSVVDEFLPESWKYARMHGSRFATKFGNQDLHVMFGMDQALTGIEKKWRRDYFLPAKADVGVLAFRNWLDKYSDGDVKWAPGAKNEEAKSLEEVFDRWGRHTKHCKHCKKTAKDLIFLGSLLRKVAVASLIASGVSLLVSGLKAKPCIAGLVIAGLAMLATRKVDSALSWLKSSVPLDALPGNVDLGYRESTG
ncbi:hypothetical protein BSKO_05571 [Bryopsis sp. KO-2023]|nr:hypothetical protein BSKO_05571 [Bryopsis sp. KO-2023]